MQAINLTSLLLGMLAGLLLVASIALIYLGHQGGRAECPKCGRPVRSGPLCPDHTRPGR